MPISSAPFLDPAGVAVALAGIDTPLDFSVAAPASPEVAVIITAVSGTLSTALFPGATVGGDGTASLWLAGTAADVNAKLATLVYAAPLAGADTISVPGSSRSKTARASH